MTFRDMRHDKQFLVEAIFLGAASAFDIATTIDNSNRHPNGHEVNPMMRVLIGNHPHGARPYAVMFAINTMQLDLHHYIKRITSGKGDDFATFINMSAGFGHVAAGMINLNDRPCDPEQSRLCPKNQAHLH